MTLRAALPALLLLLVSCASRRGDEIVVCGEWFHTGTKVVLWSDPGGFDAYSEKPAFPGEVRPGAEVPEGPRYGERSAGGNEVREGAWSLEALRDRVDQCVIHYDACGWSRRCFQVLQDRRGLSAHFLLDLDGTLYQTLDLRERALHAGAVNDRSIGIEIAHIGAYPEGSEVLGAWYPRDRDGPRIVLPRDARRGRLPEDFVGRPARKGRKSAVIQDREVFQFDYTEEQYHALVHLLATLSRVFPHLRLDFPRDPEGNIETRALDPEGLEAWSGLLAHWHVSKAKVDPGPAFDWERVIREARRIEEGKARRGPIPGFWCCHHPFHSWFPLYPFPGYFGLWWW